MGSKTEIGHVVWHDLLTQDVTKARRFYADLLSWNYQIEHASNFVWGAGEADYPLILADGEAHGGFVHVGQGIHIPSCWIAYVMVMDVDAVSTKAKSLGATIEREPFDTPGVGRSAVIRDLQGAIICLTCPTHSFPAPRGTFLWDELITNDAVSAKLFYGELFGWRFHDTGTDQTDGYTILKCADDTDAAGMMTPSLSVEGFPGWVTYLATNDVDVTVTKANVLGAHVIAEGFDQLTGGRKAVLLDPTGAVFGLLKPNNPAFMN
ncbi:MAG: VOC family protein [Cyanobacteria bacterium P01_A01_bin.37]